SRGTEGFRGLLLGSTTLHVAPYAQCPVVVVRVGQEEGYAFTGEGNPGKVTTLADLAKPGVKFVTTPPDVPIGAYARASLKKLASDPSNGNGYEAKVLANIVSEEANVRQVVVKVQLGEADAGICYATDVTAVPAGEVTTIDIPDSANVVAEYTIAILKSAKAPAAARRLISFINSPSGQSILVAAKFKPA
ncbi:MAG: molybdate ABC transporter substrate-binding protein, partial [Proteobacteria bacterium]|nr:molybdate ABC transporter substrate-binding protein [Pseudomonadota bacterium]